jgi:hypothetical protein
MIGKGFPAGMAFSFLGLHKREIAFFLAPFFVNFEKF